ncbi:MAG TPA: hypothetical protein VK846_17335 [Candidatus Limnocylindria bacterium]|nr:hypothetical protein [Candidatus Limnocylindria bacterium]
MIVFIAIMVGIGLGKWLIYTGLLWLMIKIQKLNYNLLGLFASSLLATGLGYIPLVGQYVGWAVLVLCLWKCTGADIAPDVLFTVGVAGALMFCVNLFAIGALMGSLALAGPMFGEMADDMSNDESFAEVDEEDDEEEESDGTTNTVRVAGAPWRTNAPGAGTKSAPRKASVASATRGTPATTTMTSVASRALAAQLTLKGVGVNGSGRSAMIASGKQIYTVGLGETLSVPGGSGTVTLTCEDISHTSVTLAMERGEKIKVGFQ